VELTEEETRVLGCLIEKAATTPDNYPLSTNALVAACNQSTSRDPVVNYPERVIDAAMLSLRELGLARTVRGDGQRVNKHRHVAGEAWRVDDTELAVLSVLMLRGPQTIAELRTRIARYGGADGAVDAALDRLAQRETPLAEQLPRRPGEREARWRQLVGVVVPSSPAAGAGEADTAERLVATPAGRLVMLEERVAGLEAAVNDLHDRLRDLATALGYESAAAPELER